MHILSMLFITFRFLLLNAFNILPNYLSLSCSSISHDGSLVAGGFSDSSLKVYFFIFPLAPFHEPFWKQTLFQWSFYLTSWLNFWIVSAGLGYGKAWTTAHQLWVFICKLLLFRSSYDSCILCLTNVSVETSIMFKTCENILIKGNILICCSDLIQFKECTR